MNIRLLNFTVKGDETGSLVALELHRNIPFAVKRVYYIFDTKAGIVRGRHAHRKLEQILVSIKGRCQLRLDDGKEKRVVGLNKPTMGLYLGPLLWRELFNFSPDCVLMVLASELYDESDYIRNYDTFCNELKDR